MTNQPDRCRGRQNHGAPHQNRLFRRHPANLIVAGTKSSEVRSDSVFYLGPEDTENIITCLRQELMEHGEMLALLDAQRPMGPPRHHGDLAGAIRHQRKVLGHARAQRARCLRATKRGLKLTASTEPLGLLPHLPPDYRPLVQALFEENAELVLRLRERARPVPSHKLPYG